MQMSNRPESPIVYRTGSIGHNRPSKATGWHSGLSAILLIFLSVLPSIAEEGTAPALNADPTSKPLQWNAGLDGYASQNFNDPASGLNGLRGFDTHTGFRLGGANLDVDYKARYFGAHVTAGYGDRYEGLAGSDIFRGGNRYLSQYYVSYRPLKDTGLQFDFGKFYTSVGAEVTDPQANFNYSRSLLFSVGEPYYHSGLRATIPVTKTFTAGVQVLQGWNSVIDNNSRKTLGFTTALTQTKWSWSQAILVGSERADTTDGKRQLMNEVVTFSPHSSVQTYVELLYGRDKRAGVDTGADAWYGTAIAARWNAMKRLSFSPRFEYLVDQSGLMSGMPQHLHEWTGTAEYRMLPSLSTRLEYRDDFSNQPFFERGTNGRANRQSTVTLAVLMTLKGEH